MRGGLLGTTCSKWNCRKPAKDVIVLQIWGGEENRPVCEEHWRVWEKACEEQGVDIKLLTSRHR